MQLRNDYKYALVDEYRTFWNAYDNPNEFYHDVMSSSDEMTHYLMSKTRKILGANGVVERIIYSQNELWLVYYCNNKRTLKAMCDFDRNEAVQKLQRETRFVCRGEILDLTKEPGEEPSDQAAEATPQQ